MSDFNNQPKWNLSSVLLVQNLLKHNYFFPNIAQSAILDGLKNHKNNIIVAKTGTGKTVSLIIYLIDYLTINPEHKVFFILPTRELVLQVFQLFKLFIGRNLPLNVKVLTQNFDSSVLYVNDIFVTTPQKIQEALYLKIEWTSFKLLLVLDEVDTLVEMGFVEDLQMVFRNLNRVIIKKIAASATIPKGLMHQLRIWIRSPYQNIIESEKITFSDHYFLITREEKQLSDLLVLLNYYSKKSGIFIFTNSKNEANNLNNWIKENSDFKPVVFHSELQQQERKQAMSKINDDEQVIVVSTDLLARGISVKHIQTVINFNLPKDKIWYLHRSGRTGRYNQPGQIINLIFEKEIDKINHLAKSDIKFKEIKIQKNQVVIKSALKKKVLESEKTKKEIQKILASAPKKVKPNYKKKTREKIQKVKKRAKREMIEANVKQELLKKWKADSVAKRNKK